MKSFLQRGDVLKAQLSSWCKHFWADRECMAPILMDDWLVDWFRGGQAVFCLVWVYWKCSLSFQNSCNRLMDKIYFYLFQKAYWASFKGIKLVEKIVNVISPIHFQPIFLILLEQFLKNLEYMLYLYAFYAFSLWLYIKWGSFAVYFGS